MVVVAASNKNSIVYIVSVHAEYIHPS